MTAYDLTGTIVPRSAEVRAATCMPTASALLGFPFTVAFAIWVPSDVTSVRGCFGTRAPGVGPAFPAVPGAKFAVGAHDGNYGYAATPAVVDPFVIPAGGVAGLTPPLAVTRGTDGRILAVLAIPTGTRTGYFAGAAAPTIFGKCSASIAQVYPLPALIDCNNPLCFKLIYSTNDRSLVVFGDSITAGCYSHYEDGTFQALGPLGGIAVDNRARNGYRLDQLATDAPAEVYIFDDARVDGADVWIDLGTNDLHGIMALETMQANALLCARNAKARGARRVYFSTVPPSVFVTSTNNEPTRNAYNDWLKGLPSGIFGVADLDPLLQSSPGVLNPMYDKGDGTHLNTAGQQAKAPVILATLNA